MSESGKESLRVVVFQEGDAWIAQGLEHDIAAQGSDLEAVRERFVATFAAEQRQAREQGKQTLDIAPAPEHFFQMWEERSSFSAKLDGGNDSQVELALCA
jgi:hypothetical protein